MGGMVNRTSYQDPNVNVDTLGAGGGPGGLEIDPFFMNMAKRRARLAAEEQAMRNRAMKFDLGKKLQDQTFSGPTREDREAATERSRDRVYKAALQDADLNPKKKLIQGFNINPGYIEDTTLLPVSMRPKNAGFGQAETNTAGIDPKSKGTGGFDPVAAEDAARGELGAPGGNLAGPSFDSSMLQMTAEEEAKKRLQKQAQQQYFSGRG